MKKYHNGNLIIDDKKIIAIGYIGERYDDEITFFAKKEERLIDPLFSIDEVFRELPNNIIIGESSENFDEDFGGINIKTKPITVSYFSSDEEMSLEEANKLNLMKVLGGNLDTVCQNVGYSAWTITGFELEQFSVGGHNIKEELDTIKNNKMYMILIIEWD